VLDRVRDRLRGELWHALNRYDELKRRVRENQAGRSAVGFVALLLLGIGAALGFIAANAAARDEITAVAPARASNLGGLYTVTQAVVSQKTVRVPAKHAGRQHRKTVTITKRTPTLPARTVASTRTVLRTITRSRTLTVTDVQTTIVTVTEEDGHGHPGPGF
jgi:hypothetical protein